jgi:hypothetical protein
MQLAPCLAIRKTRLGNIPAVNKKIVQLLSLGHRKVVTQCSQPVIEIDLSVSSREVLISFCKIHTIPANCINR